MLFGCMLNGGSNDVNFGVLFISKTLKNIHTQNNIQYYAPVMVAYFLWMLFSLLLEMKK